MGSKVKTDESIRNGPLKWRLRLSLLNPIVTTPTMEARVQLGLNFGSAIGERNHISRSRPKKHEVHLWTQDNCAKVRQYRPLLLVKSYKFIKAIDHSFLNQLNIWLPVVIEVKIFHFLQWGKSQFLLSLTMQWAIPSQSRIFEISSLYCLKRVHWPISLLKQSLLMIFNNSNLSGST